MEFVHIKKLAVKGLKTYDCKVIKKYNFNPVFQNHPHIKQIKKHQANNNYH